MLSRDKLNKLYILATGKQPIRQEVNTLKEQKKKTKLDKFKVEREKYKGIVVDPLDAWSSWYEKIHTELDNDTADDAWNFAKGEFPGSEEQANEWLRNFTKNQVEAPDPAVKEVNLRNTMSKSPSWIAEEMLPTMAQTSVSVANQNLSKTKAVYKKTLEQKLLSLDLTGLDPEVPVEQHVNDALMMESLGLLDSAQIQNGRFMTVSKDGRLQPAFALNEENNLTDLGPEGMLIEEIAEPLFKSYIESAMSQTTGMMSLDNKASSAEMLRMLKNGDMDISEWRNALSVIGDADGTIDAGLDGLITKNPTMSSKDIASASIDISNIMRGL